MIDLTVRCPAGEEVAETDRSAACRCRVEHNTLSVVGDPSSLRAFCLGRYETCPTWRMEKERIWKARREALADKALDEDD